MTFIVDTLPTVTESRQEKVTVTDKTTQAALEEMIELLKVLVLIANTGQDTDFTEDDTE